MTAEPHPSLGEFLRQERERRGITIEQVASATKIGVRLLHSLEGDQFAELPAKPFIRGFVTSYCRFIGLDPKDVLTRFGGFIDERAHDRPNRESGHSGYAFEKTGADRSRIYLGAFMGGFVVLAGVAFVFLKPSLHHHHGTHLDKLRSAHASPDPSPDPASPGPAASLAVLPAASSSPNPSPTVSEAAPTPSPSTTAVVTATPSPPAAEEAEPAPEPSPTLSAKDPLSSGLDLKAAEIKYKAVFKALESVWVRYRVDDRPMMKFILRKDKVLVLRARSLIRFQASDAKQVRFSLNGQGYHLLAGNSDVAMRQGDATLIIPHELAETTKEPFPGEKPLTGRAVPQPRATDPLSTPSL